MTKPEQVFGRLGLIDLTFTYLLSDCILMFLGLEFVKVHDPRYDPSLKVNAWECSRNLPKGIGLHKAKNMGHSAIEFLLLWNREDLWPHCCSFPQWLQPRISWPPSRQSSDYIIFFQLLQLSSRKHASLTVTWMKFSYNRKLTVSQNVDSLTSLKLTVRS